jgi:hypothetical protein
MLQRMVMKKGKHLVRVNFRRYQQVATILLVLWVALGVVHTAFSFVRKGFPPSRPPVAGIAPAYVQEVTALHELIENGKPARVLLLLPASTDTGVVVFLRYQLAYIDYPVRIFARRSMRETHTELADESAVITGRSVALPADWRARASRDTFVLYQRQP